MQLIILGENTDDKGSQLESLTLKLLSQLRYSKLVTNVIGTGGQEVDVSAEHAMPEIGETASIKVLCECKAHKQPVGMSDWLKFLGKLWSERLANGVDARGCFIALNGVNGNVFGHYESMKAKGMPIKLVTGESLIAEISKQFQCCSLESLVADLGRMTARRPVEYAMCYYQQDVNWVVKFADDTFTLIAAKGCSDTVPDVSKLTGLIADSMSGQFVDLAAERAAQEQLARQNVIVIGSLFVCGGHGSVVEIQSQMTRADGQVPDTALVVSTLDRLAQQGLVAEANGDWKLLPNGDQPGEVVLLLRAFMEGIDVSAIGCGYYDKLIDDALLGEICRIQGDLPIPEEWRERVLRILQWSPHALAWSLYPEPLIVAHRGQGTPMNEDDFHIFISNITERLAADFRLAPLREYFYRVRKIVEIDVSRTAIVKGPDKAEAEIAWRDRVVIGELDDSLGGGLRHMRALNNSPEPWEWRNQLQLGKQVNVEGVVT
ncbi:MAG: hypothetical protein U0941_17380 [Planctomycetaceae bacterium]